MIELKHVYKSYHSDRQILKNISLKLEKGSFIFLTGHSGAGKSTLIKLLTLQEKTTTGQIFVLGENLEKYNHKNIHLYRRKLGLVFQDFKLIAEDSIYNQLALPLININLNKNEIDKKIHEVLDKVQLPHSYLNELPEYLSGGEQQKIALARAIIHKPQIILADEPTGNLDKKSSEQVLNILKEQSDFGVTVIFATHDEHLIQNNKFKNYELKNGEFL